MRLALTAVFLVCALFTPGSAQTQDPSDPATRGIGDPRKFDEYGSLMWPDEKARLDNVAAELSLHSDEVVYLYAYNGRRGCVGEALARVTRAKDYLVKKRGIKSDRVIWKDAGHREDFVIEFWVEPRWASAPYASPTVDPSEARPRDCKHRKRRVRSKS